MGSGFWTGVQGPGSYNVPHEPQNGEHVKVNLLHQCDLSRISLWRSSKLVQLNPMVRFEWFIYNANSSSADFFALSDWP
jgi:hypothetical protein